jgi:hypothetical protein
MTWNLENLFRPGTEAGPDSTAIYEAKLEGLAAKINQQAPDALSVQEVGEPVDQLGDHVLTLLLRFGVTPAHGKNMFVAVVPGAIELNRCDPDHPRTVPPVCEA